MIEAVLFDFGGVITSSPFEAFTFYEKEIGLPLGTIRRLNATNPDSNAWAQFERNEIDLDGFVYLFEEEASSLGFQIDARRVLSGALNPQVRSEMVTVVERCSKNLKTGLLTNNIRPIQDPISLGDRSSVDQVISLFDVIVQSSAIGVRKPETQFYKTACEELKVEPSVCVFLDDLGVNLKPAREMGMTTIKVDDPMVAIEQLETLLGFSMR